MVKALDLSPSGLSPRGFEPRRMQLFVQKEKPAGGIEPPIYRLRSGCLATWPYRLTTRLAPRTNHHRKLGRVVKALALGASLERGTGSNPVACSLFCKKSSRSETRTHNLPVNSRARYRLRHPGTSDSKKLAVPGVEPGSSGSQPLMLTTTPYDQFQ